MGYGLVVVHCAGLKTTVLPNASAPGCAWMLADIFAAAGLPAGVFNLVMANGPREQGPYAREFYTTVKTSYIGT